MFLRYEGLGNLTLVVIFVSLAYYFAVVWCEVVAVMFPSLAFSFLSGGVEGSRDALIVEEENDDEKDTSGLNEVSICLYETIYLSTLEIILCLLMG